MDCIESKVVQVVMDRNWRGQRDFVQDNNFSIEEENGK